LVALKPLFTLIALDNLFGTGETKACPCPAAGRALQGGIQAKAIWIYSRSDLPCLDFLKIIFKVHAEAS